MLEAVVDGRTGWLVHADGAEAFADVLRGASADRAEVAARGTAARHWVQTNFDVTKMCEAYGAVYRSLVSGVENGRGS